MKRMVVVLGMVLILFVTNVFAESTVSFSDVSKGHWAKGAIEFLMEREIINVVGDGTFNPNGLVTRAEVCTFLVKAFNLRPNGNGKDFGDTVNSWEKNYISITSSWGIVNGCTSNEFKPDRQISRQELCVMILTTLRVLGKGETITKVEVEELLSVFADKDSIGSWARIQVAEAVKRGLIVGFIENGKRLLKPVSTITRAEVAVIIKKAYDLSGVVISVPVIHDYLIVVNTTSNHLTLFDNKVKIVSCLVATGKMVDGKCISPNGKFVIVNKIEEPSWGGGGFSNPVAGGDPNNPLGHYWMGTSAPPRPGQSWGIHGNSNYDSIGNNASHGCIRMYNEEIPKLFNIVPVGTAVWIGTAEQLTSWGVVEFE